MKWIGLPCSFVGFRSLRNREYDLLDKKGIYSAISEVFVHKWCYFPDPVQSCFQWQINNRLVCHVKVMPL